MLRVRTYKCIYVFFGWVVMLCRVEVKTGQVSFESFLENGELLFCHDIG